MTPCLQCMERIADGLNCAACDLCCCFYMVHLINAQYAGEVRCFVKCFVLQFGQEMAPAQQAGLREHPATVRLARIVEERWAEWGGRAANNIGWAQAVLGHGSPTLMAKVPHAASPSMRCTALDGSNQGCKGSSPCLVFFVACTVWGKKVPLCDALPISLDERSLCCAGGGQVLRPGAQHGHHGAQRHPLVLRQVGPRARSRLQRRGALYPCEVRPSGGKMCGPSHVLAAGLSCVLLLPPIFFPMLSTPDLGDLQCKPLLLSWLLMLIRNGVILFNVHIVPCKSLAAEATLMSFIMFPKVVCRRAGSRRWTSRASP